MKFTLSSLALLAATAGAATVSHRNDAVAFQSVNAKPVPAGFFEAHETKLGIQESLTVADVSINARAITHVFVCINAQFKPACENVQLNTNQCINFGGNFIDSISSIGPDQGTTCQLFQDINCSGHSIVGIVNPGIFDPNDFNFNDVASSVRCV